MTEVLASSHILNTLRQVNECLGHSERPEQLLDRVTSVIGKHLHVDRCSILLVNKENQAKPFEEFVVVGDYSRSAIPIKGKSYKVADGSELLALLQSGKPVPLKDLAARDDGTNPRDLQYIGEDTSSKTLAVFPLRSNGRLTGCLTLHMVQSSRQFSDEILELGEVLSEIIGMKFCEESFSTSSKKQTPVDSTEKNSGELVTSLSKQLSWERWVRQIICKLHATLDRDLLLQSVADGFGRSLGASRCLIVRTDGLASPVVTHEYVEPEISPLGLGRTGPFPLGAIMPFRHKAGALPDVSVLQTSGDLSREEYEYFSENGVRSMAGAPIASHGTYYGVIVILEREASRKWAPQELDMLELVASQTAVAMGHCQSYLQLKDQLFNLNLLGNLTQQLTSTLELVSRGSVKSEPSSEEKMRLALNAPPLSMRELEVLKLIASGLANREIAQRLFLTESTVELHASRIRKKLKLKSRTALVKYACDNGLA